MKAMPRGTSMRPSMPDRKKRGTKLTMMMSVELRMGMRTSREALKTTCRTGRRLPAGRARFSCRRRQTFSTSTMASSTSDPMAMAMPPSDMVLMVRPIQWSTSREMTSDRGRVTSEMIVVRTFARKRKRTMTTKRLPSTRDFLTFPMELSMKRL